MYPTDMPDPRNTRDPKHTRELQSAASPVKRVLGLLLLLVAVVAGGAAAMGSFLILVRFSSRVLWIEQLAMLVCLLVTGAVAWWASALVSRPYRVHLAAATTAVGTWVVLAVAGSTVLRSMDFPYTRYPEPPDVGYWDLSTGSRLAYLYTPAATATADPAPVIFVHGGPGLPEFMDQDVRRSLAEAGFDVYTYHQFGAGLSSRATSNPGQEYTVARHVADLDAIRETLEAERVILVGQSWGGTLSASYAAAHPERIEKLVLTSPGPSWLPAFELEQIQVLSNLDDDDIAELRGIIRPYVRRLALYRFLQGIHPEAADQFLGERQLDGFMEAQGRVTRRAFVCDSSTIEDVAYPGQGYFVNRHVFADMRRVSDPRPRFREVEAPVLILKPECDYVDWEVTVDFRDWFPNATLVRVPGAGHEIRFEQPDLYVRSVRSFLLNREPL